MLFQNLGTLFLRTSTEDIVKAKLHYMICQALAVLKKSEI